MICLTIMSWRGLRASAFQLLCAQILSTAYAMIMMAVIVGTALQLGEDGIGSPSAIFLISLSSSFFIAACLHPQEFWCIVPGIIYLLSIPSMYLLLILYSIINLNVVSWGTREVQVKKTKKVRVAQCRFSLTSIFVATCDSHSRIRSSLSTLEVMLMKKEKRYYLNYLKVYIYRFTVHR